MKKKIGFVINFSHNRWLGGSNYFNNLFEGLIKYSKNKIVIFTGIDKNKLNPAFLKHKIVYLKILDPSKKINILINYIRFICLILLKRDFIFENILKKHNIDILSHAYPLGKNSKIKSIYWIPDMQDLNLKELFTFKQKLKRTFERLISLYHSNIILFSCKTIRDEFIKKYPKAHDKTKILNFINKLPNKKPKGNLYKKFKNYFLISNQFWIHKNYDLVIDSLVDLKKNNLHPTILSTGAKLDWRSSKYYHDLINRIKKNKIENFKILGIISRNEQLNLILNANYLINPSKSEGWNTAVEEAKSLNTKVLASNIEVHKEQLKKKGEFFDIKNFKNLSKILKKKNKSKKKYPKKNYNLLLKRNNKEFKIFAINYIKILEKIR